MKIFVFSIALSVVLLAAGCNKSCISNTTPECINNTIEANKNNADWGVESINEYEYQGQIVYALVERYVDGQTGIIKSDCTSLCSLGGIAGNEICNGDKFYEKAIFKRKVWER